MYIQDRIVRNVHTYAKPCTITYARCKIVHIQDGIEDVHISDLTGNMHTNRTFLSGLELRDWNPHVFEFITWFFFYTILTKAKCERFFMSIPEFSRQEDV